MINIVIPMAGHGSRFVAKGYKDPKPFIDVDGKPMIQRVVENLIPYEPHRFIFIARKEHEEYIKRRMRFATDVIYVDKVTEGAACTVLLAKKLINSIYPLVIANSDQLVRWNMETIAYLGLPRLTPTFPLNTGGGYTWRESNNIQDMINNAVYHNADATIATFYATHPKWSYAKLDSKKNVVEVAEKRVISEHATAGIYYYKRGSDFVKYANKMIDKNTRVNGEFYVCPVFNEMIDSGKHIRTYQVSEMIGLGTPEDLQRYLND